ncbi:MAG: phosphodiester glycosidase family protein, partial [Propionibacteriales bacterium]|nr:phosphodiester glycosidase family protein [Propionibacteriales bacterium]
MSRLLRRTALALAAVLALPLLLAPPTTARAEGDQVAATAAALTKGDSALLSSGVSEIAPGLTLTNFRRLQPGGWVTGQVMDADLGTESLSLDVADGGTVSGSNETVEGFARGAKAVAAVNGDYFDMNASDAPIGANVSSKTGVRTLPGQPRQTFTIANGKAAVQSLMSGATLTVDGRTEKLGSVNSPTFEQNSIGLFNSAWGTHPLTRLLTADEAVRVLTVIDGTVTGNTTDRAAAVAPTKQGTSVLVARGTAGDRLAAVALGTPAELAVQASAEVDLAVGGDQRLLTDGKIGTADQVTAARTAVGVSKDGASIKVVTIDGRAGDAHGMTIQELARFMADLGVWNAVNLDGGGSTTLAARPAGTSDLQLINRPSDGSQRLDSNALVFRSTATTPTVPGVRLRPALQSPAGVTNDAAHATLTGLSRTLLATGLDANLALTPTSAKVGVADPAARIEQTSDRPDGRNVVLRGAKPGVATVTATDSTAGGVPRSDDTTINVYGKVTAIEPSSALLALPDDKTSGIVRLTAIDGDGNRVPVETRDVTAKASKGVAVTPKGLDAFTVTPVRGATTSSVEFTVAGQTATVPVTIGTEDVELADFADVADWKPQTARATGTLESATGPEGGPAMALDFDFSTSTATRGMFALPATPIAIKGQPQSLSLWIKGTGKGEWPRLQVTKGDGTSTNLDGALISWQGWRKVTFAVPAGTPYPLTLTAIRFMETRSDVSYTDRLEIADLRAQVPAAVDLPETRWPTDPSIITNGTTDDRPLRIATVSDTQFVARNPDSDLVKAGRRALREVVAAKPDLLVINGDLVDEDSPAHIDLAKKVLTEEVGTTVPWVYGPGNHEVMGGSISNFAAIFGDTATTRVIKKTKIITLDSSSGGLHPGGSTDQLRMLERELRSATTDPGVTGVVVFNHHPVDDPQPDKASQLTDRYEAGALADRLADFRRGSGKSIAQVNAHVGSFHGSARDGVSRVINGNSGKNPSGSPEHGGFTGWSMVGIDP